MENDCTEPMVLKCEHCGKVLVPQKHMCPECGSVNLTDMPIGGDGKVFTHTTIYVAPSWCEGQVPYNVALIELPELILTGRIVNPNAGEIKIDDRVSFFKRDKGIYWFKLLD